MGLRDGQRPLHLRHPDAAQGARARDSRTFLGTEDTILYSSCFDANGGVFEALFGAEDAIISDELNHASIIDGIRLSKAARYRYRNADMADLEAQLVAATGRPAQGASSPTASSRWTATSRRWTRSATSPTSTAPWSWSTTRTRSGFVGDGGRGTPEHFGVMDRVDILTGTLGKALGGASGGYVAAHQEIVDLLRQRVPALPLLQRRRARRSPPAR